MRALVSTSDKTGLIEFLSPFLPLGLEVVSTGGTYDYLKNHQIPVQDISAVTGFPEVLDGRVKTLHPHVHMGLLADQRLESHRKQLEQHNVKAFDLVVGNLYPFEKTALQPNASFDELIENIDIGGPSFLRASAKNFQSVIVVCSPLDYKWVQEKILNHSLTVADRQKLALKVFSLISYYDALIVNRLSESQDDQEYLNIPLKRKQKLRYGENPQQKAVWFENPLDRRSSLSDARQLQGKELSYNNLLDLDACVQLVAEFEQPTCVAVKHNNPCGVASADTAHEACQKTIEADPKSIFGGIIGLNVQVDLEMCQLFKDIFLECIIAPDFTQEALNFLSTKKNLRLLVLENFKTKQTTFQQVKSVAGGVLWQEYDSYSKAAWKFIGAKPTESYLKSYEFSEKVVSSLKSNAIAIVSGTQTIGLGMGQVNRVDAVQQALQRANEFCQRMSVPKDNLVLASDAFFPFADSLELIADAGIRHVLQPGGSLQDAAVVSTAEKYSINMVMTGQRHFKH